MDPLESGSEPQALTRELNQLLRRLRHYQTEGEWASAVLDGASRFMRRGALFLLREGVLTLRGQIHLGLPDALSIAISSAAAFAAAVESRDPLVALRTPSEVGPALSAPGEHAHIVPICNQERVVALLFAAAGEGSDEDALELVAGMASSVLERQVNASLHTQIARRLGSSS
jgi:hypothetical protein